MEMPIKIVKDSNPGSLVDIKPMLLIHFGEMELE